MGNKVKYGLKNVYYAKATIAEDGSATYTKPVAWPGAVSLAMDPEGETSKFYADNVAYAQFSTNAGYTGTYESALIPDSFRKDILGEIEDANGVMLEDAGAAAGHFALLFQFEGDVEGTRHVLYNCVATRPSVSGSTTEESSDPQTESLEISCGSIYVEDIDKDVVKAKAKPDSLKYNTWFDSVYISSGVAVAGA